MVLRVPKTAYGLDAVPNEDHVVQPMKDREKIVDQQCRQRIL
jgi:hypothetical protein